MNIFILVLVAAQRIGELWLANRNTNRLISNGAREFGAEHYKWIVILHSAWMASLFLTVRPNEPLNLYWILIFLVLQGLRVWVIQSLGPYWTTRIIRPRNSVLVAHGPYRFVKHPNYLVVIGEIFALPLAFGKWEIALIFSILNAIVLTIRIRQENLALKSV